MPNINIPQKRIEELEGALEGKQDTLIAGANITIVNNVISSTARRRYTELYFYATNFSGW